MIKISVITNNSKWLSYFKNPNVHVEKQTRNLNKKIKIFRKKNFFVQFYFRAVAKLENLIGNLEIKINQLIFYLFLFIKKKTYNSNLKKIKKFILEI